MKILLLGATGRTGKHILKELIEQNYSISCLVRNPKKLTVKDDKITIFKGSPSKIDDLSKALKECTHVISALNISRTSDFPWSKLRTPKTFLSDVMKNVITLSKTHLIERVIICSAWGVAETQKDIPFWFNLTIKFSNIKFAYLDHERQEKALQNSNLNYTIVRPVGLTNFKNDKTVIESYQNNPKPNLLISRKKVAKFMMNALLRDDLIGKAPVIYE